MSSVAGALVGFYGGLAAGIFANLIGVVSGLVFGVRALMFGVEPPRELVSDVVSALLRARWHPEFAVIGLPLGAAALLVARFIPPGEDRDLAKKRLRVLALLLLGALALYYPLVGLGALNRALSAGHKLHELLPPWLTVLVPGLGGIAVGRLLRNRPEVHGHGVPEVVRAVQTQGGLRARGGVLKLLASAVTIGTGGSAGREGPIVYGGAAFGSAVGRTLGFTHRELAVLLAGGAGAGIAASFNAPVAGAILRDGNHPPRVRAPGALANHPRLGHRDAGRPRGDGRLGNLPARVFACRYVGEPELLAYVGLGLVCGLLGFWFTRLLHRTEELFHGRLPNPLSKKLGSWPLETRAGIGGFLVGGMALLSPAVWGTGHRYFEPRLRGAARAAVPDPRLRTRRARRHRGHDRLRRLGRHVLPRDGDRRDGRRRVRRSSTSSGRRRPRPPEPTRSSEWAASSRRSPAARSPG